MRSCKIFWSWKKIAKEKFRNARRHQSDLYLFLDLEARRPSIRRPRPTTILTRRGRSENRGSIRSCELLSSGLEWAAFAGWSHFQRHSIFLHLTLSPSVLFGDIGDSLRRHG